MPLQPSFDAGSTTSAGSWSDLPAGSYLGGSKYQRCTWTPKERRLLWALWRSRYEFTSYSHLPHCTCSWRSPFINVLRCKRAEPSVVATGVDGQPRIQKSLRPFDACQHHFEHFQPSLFQASTAGDFLFGTFAGCGPNPVTLVSFAAGILKLC